MSVDAVGQALAIARSASGDDVNWSREPLTEREAKIRRAWLDRQLEVLRAGEDSLDVSIASLEISIATHGCRRREQWPRDLRAAYEEADQLRELFHAREHHAKFRAFADELDAEDRAANG